VSNPAQAFRGHFRVRGGIEPFVTAGQKNVGDAVSSAYPACQSPAAKEFGVIWVGEYNENVLWGCPVFGFECHKSIFTKYGLRIA
jgi:hypothetical protein